MAQKDIEEGTQEITIGEGEMEVQPDPVEPDAPPEPPLAPVQLLPPPPPPAEVIVLKIEGVPLVPIVNGGVFFAGPPPPT